VTALVLLDHPAGLPDADGLAPVTTARPLAEVRAGARLIRERWASAHGLPVTGVIAAPRLQGFEEPGSVPTLRDADVVAAGSIVAISHFAPSLARIDSDAYDTWTHETATVAVRLAHDTRVAELRATGITAGARPQAIAGWHLSRPWDLIGHLPAMLGADALEIARASPSTHTPGSDVRVIGEFPVHIAATATIEPFVLLDASQGAIVIGDHAVVRAFSRLAGPFVLGAHSQWMTGSGSTVSIGDHCKISGEVSTTIVCGHANKGHDGFLGHSYLGRWTNLGAGTVTSNLKNTYGAVSFAGEVTGLQFLGAILGDHAKTGILTRLTTGSSIGVGANVISDDVVPSVMPAFAWGAHGDRYDCERFLQTAERVMARRTVTLTTAMRACLRAVYDGSAPDSP
jgi:UDP-N-acetylglucosamine diphosphorylase / glucose-1-phosphate thymidylyltransferase / UDP-N-acetylgalactosamine diphosphorylase / glucosamine-1-phosphate N-acetyltransferase / galactosamine-1-phosphate N-acetyltransferase